MAFMKNRAVGEDVLDIQPIQLDEAKTEAILKEFNRDRSELNMRMGFVDGDEMYFGSCAVLRAFKVLQFPYPFVSFVGSMFPLAIRDPVYMLFSRNRHRWFGMMG